MIPSLLVTRIQARAIAANGYLADVDEDDEAVIGQVCNTFLFFLLLFRVLLVTPADAHPHCLMVLYG